MLELLNLPLRSITESSFNPRKTFNAVKLQELADSIKASGVHQPILVRPLPGARVSDTERTVAYEIVAGSRRFRASQQAGLETIPAVVCQLDDTAAMEACIIENLQRDDLTDLEAAEGYQALMKHNSLTADEVGKKIGKSRTFIYNCLKLLDLHSAAKEALRGEHIPASHALLIARIPDIGLQAKALAFAIQADGEGHQPSYRTFSAWLRTNVMLDLEKAPFPIKVTTLVATAGSCQDCDKRTGANPDLFSDIKSADMCTHPPCYHIKAEAHKDALAALAAKAEAKKVRNANVDDQQGLGLESTLAQDARKNQSADKTAAMTVDRLKSDIESIKNSLNADIAKATRLATFDCLTDIMKKMTAKASEALLGAHLMRAWLQKLVIWEDYDDVALMLGLPIQDSYDQEFTDTCTRRVDAATDGELYVFAATYLLLEERNATRLNALKPATLMEGFAKDWNIDLRPIAVEVREAAEAELKAKIADFNKQIKAKKPSKSLIPHAHAPAGAAIDTGEANAKKSKPAGASRKAKTTEQEAISGIAAAMQGLGSEPLDASLGGSGAAATDSGKLAVGAKVKVLDGKHAYKDGAILSEVGDNMWNVSLSGGATGMFSTYLPTKSLQVIA